MLVGFKLMEATDGTADDDEVDEVDEVEVIVMFATNGTTVLLEAEVEWFALIEPAEAPAEADAESEGR